MPRPEDQPRPRLPELTPEQRDFIERGWTDNPKEWVDGAPYYEWSAKPMESPAEFNERMEGKGSLERMRDGCNYTEFAGHVCRKCGEVHGELPVPLLLAAARRNLQSIRNKARDAWARNSPPGETVAVHTDDMILVRACDALMSDLNALERDIARSSLAEGNR